MTASLSILIDIHTKTIRNAGEWVFWADEITSRFRFLRSDPYENKRTGRCTHLGSFAVVVFIGPALSAPLILIYSLFFSSSDSCPRKLYSGFLSEVNASIRNEKTNALRDVRIGKMTRRRGVVLGQLSVSALASCHSGCCPLFRSFHGNCCKGVPEILKLGRDEEHFISLNHLRTNRLTPQLSYDMPTSLLFSTGQL